MKLKISILARLIFFSYHWVIDEDNSCRAIPITKSYKLLLGDWDEPNTEDSRAASKDDTRETLRILWELKSSHILDCYWNDPWSHSYRIDIGNDAIAFLSEYDLILQSLTWAEQVELRKEAFKYAAERRNANTLRILFQSQSPPCVSEEIGTVETRSGETGI
jgi:hypothetical protein